VRAVAGVKWLRKWHFRDARLPLPVLILAIEDATASHMHFCQLRVKPLRHSKLLFGALDQSGINFDKHRRPCVSITELSMSQSVIHVQLNCLFEEINGR